MNIKKIHIIINPASGRSEPILPILNQVMKEAEIDWDVSIPKGKDEALKLAQAAAKSNVDIVAAYGGDGTVAEVAAGLIGTNMPLAILPGGTGNVLSKELAIPQDLHQACELITKGPHELKSVDLGHFGKKYFILRTSLGYEAEMVKGAQRKHKNRFGALAYTLSSIAALKKIQHARYDITVDGTAHQVEGLTCIIANSANLGLTGVTLDKNITVTDGLLDVVVIRNGTINFWAYFLKALIKNELPDKRKLVRHWQGKNITVTSHPKQFIQCDGEILEAGALDVKIIPAALQILTPLPNINNEKH